jgi:hypothetical protein
MNLIYNTEYWVMLNDKIFLTVSVVSFVSINKTVNAINDICVLFFERLTK